MPGRLWRFHIERESTGNVLILRISGRIGSAAAPALGDALADGRRAAAAIIVDLAEVDYISGPGVAALQSAATERQGSLVVCGVTEPVHIALELAGAMSDLTIEADRAAAIVRLGARF